MENEAKSQEAAAGKRKVSKKMVKVLFWFALVFTGIRVSLYFLTEPIDAIWVQLLWIPGVLFLMALPFLVVENILDRFFGE